MKYLILVVLLLNGCSMMQPKIDECGGFSTVAEKSLCYLAKEVDTFASATKQSYLDGAITIGQVEDIIKPLNEIKRIMEDTEFLINLRDMTAAEDRLVTARELLRGLKWTKSY